MINPLLIAAGIITLSLGIAGIFIPVLPATPFFILTTGLFLKSSPALYQKLMNNKHAKTYIERKPVSYNPFLLLFAILIMWISIILALRVTENQALKIILASAGVAGTFFKGRILYRQIRNNILNKY